MPRPIGIVLVTLAALTASGLTAAGTASGTFGVNILLVPPGGAVAATSAGGSTGSAGGLPGTCISASLSERTGAVVRVVCASGQFVSISPRPGQRFFGTHGGAYGYYFGPGFGAIHRMGYGEAGGAGTITSFRVYSIEEADGPLDMLVSF